MRKSLLALALVVAGCATMGGYQPTVDPYDDPHAARIPCDEAECRELALHASGGTAKQTAVGGLPGAAGGAAIGAASGGLGAAGPTRASAPGRSSSTPSKPSCASAATTSWTEASPWVR